MVISIDMLPDDFILAIFDQFLDETWEALPIKGGIETWQCLVHVVDNGEALYLDHHIT
jgi:hypothetical protein